MHPIHRFNVTARLPEGLERLRDIALNLRWSWDYASIDLFRRLDRELWDQTSHNPIAYLGSIAQEKLEQAAKDAGFLAHYERVIKQLDEYLASKSPWFYKSKHLEGNWCIAYFSMEFGVSECLPIYSGGLGVLAGDHMKAVSDLALPVVGVGLLYQKGYFRQHLNPEGMQQELYPINDFYNMPITPIRKEDGSPVTVTVEMPKRDVHAQLWRLKIGRTEVILLDTNIDKNSTEDQVITNQLYGGGDDMRIRQEMILGIGGMRALKELHYNPLTCHMNEGHSAFLALERIRLIMQEKNVDFDVASEVVRPGTIFTTHTPVPAGIDRFSPDLIEKYFEGYRDEMGLTKDEFLALGRENIADKKESFCMAILAIKLSCYCNGVSKLHGEVSRNMWKNNWPGVPDNEVPIGSVTNGVHYRTWIAPEIAQMYDRYLGPTWSEDPTNQSIWETVNAIPSEELWRTHERQRERLISFTRRRLREQLKRRLSPPSEIDAAERVLDPRALTIGFARRFATYKRATLILSDIERLTNILSSEERPVQIIIAGKAHPRDDEGKQLIKHLISVTHESRFRNRMVFLEDYDISVARYLVQGCDIWLNNPRRLEEASGTSGMKAAINGVLNLSILDGWWDEAYHPGIGWSIGSRKIYDDAGYQNYMDATSIYQILENDAVPMFYERGSDNLPRKWVECMRETIKELCPAFNANRMVHEYAQKFYLNAVQKSSEFLADGLDRAKSLSAWKEKVFKNWSEVRVLCSDVTTPSEVLVGNPVEVSATVKLGELMPDDVAVELYAGHMNEFCDIEIGKAITMHCSGEASGNSGAWCFNGQVECSHSGQYGVTIRVRPTHPDLTGPYEMRLITWAEKEKPRDPQKEEKKEAS